MANLPWFKFYAGDWFSDGKLRKCKAEGVAVWIQTLVWMQKEESYEISGDVEEIAMALNLPTAQTDEGIRQLEKHSVCEVCRDQNGNVSLISRRLKSEHDKREGARERKRLERDRKRSECVTEDHDDVTAPSTGENHIDVTDESPIHTRGCALTSDSISDSSSDGEEEVKESEGGSPRDPVEIYKRITGHSCSVTWIPLIRENVRDDPAMDHWEALVEMWAATEHYNTRNVPNIVNAFKKQWGELNEQAEGDRRTTRNGRNVRGDREDEAGVRGGSEAEILERLRRRIESKRDGELSGFEQLIKSGYGLSEAKRLAGIVDDDSPGLPTQNGGHEVGNHGGRTPNRIGNGAHREQGPPDDAR